MSDQQIPHENSETLSCPNGTTVRLDQFDMGMREYSCPCGSTHAVVMDVHPLARWIPEAVERIFTETVEPTDEYETFSTIHVMGIVLEEYPEETVVYDASEDPSVGFALLWLTAMDANALHRVIVELLVELMDHAVSHSEDPSIAERFEQSLNSFDIDVFVDAYRDQRDFVDEFDRPV